MIHTTLSDQTALLRHILDDDVEAYIKIYDPDEMPYGAYIVLSYEIEGRSYILQCELIDYDDVETVIWMRSYEPIYNSISKMHPEEKFEINVNENGIYILI